MKGRYENLAREETAPIGTNNGRAREAEHIIHLGIGKESPWENVISQHDANRTLHHTIQVHTPRGEFILLVVS